MPRLCVIPGDGIGQEVVPAAVQVLATAVPDLQLTYAAAGWRTFLEQGSAVPPETLAAIQTCGAALFGAVASPAHPVAGYRSAILTMRQQLGLYANVRPVRSWPGVSPRADIDLIVMRENSEGLYAGRERSDGETAIAERIVTRAASRRLAEKTLALMRRWSRRRLTIVHKANVLPQSDGLFRDTVRATIAAAPDAAAEIIVDELLVDVAALHMVAAPERFDVLVTTNLYGDILSDAAAHWCGGLGMAPSLNWGDGLAVAEPVHGAAPDIAGRGLANPLAAILSGALLARLVWGLEEVAVRLEMAVYNTLTAGIDTETPGVTRRIAGAVQDHYRHL